MAFNNTSAVDICSCVYLITYQALHSPTFRPHAPQWLGWFPALYVYADECDSIWKRLKSRQFCESIMPVFGVKTVDKLKEVISKCIYDRSVCYSNSYHDAASAILTWIDLDEVAILP